MATKKPGKPEKVRKEDRTKRPDVDQPPADDDVFVLLDRIQPDAGDDPDSFIAKLSLKILDEDGARGQALIAANLHRVRIGLELIAERDKGLPEGESVADWQERRAKALGMKARNLRYVIAAAEEVAGARALAKTLPIKVLARGLTTIPKMVASFVQTGKFVVPHVALSAEQKRASLIAKFRLLGDRATMDEGGVWFVPELLAYSKGVMRVYKQTRAADALAARTLAQSVKASGVPKKGGLPSARPAQNLKHLHEGTPIKMLAGLFAGRVGKTTGNCQGQANYWVILEPDNHRLRVRISMHEETWVVVE